MLLGALASVRVEVRSEAFKSVGSNPLVGRSESVSAAIQNLNGKRELAVISGRVLRPLIFDLKNVMLALEQRHHLNA